MLYLRRYPFPKSTTPTWSDASVVMVLLMLVSCLGITVLHADIGCFMISITCFVTGLACIFFMVMAILFPLFTKRESAEKPLLRIADLKVRVVELPFVAHTTSGYAILSRLDDHECWARISDVLKIITLDHISLFLWNTVNGIAYCTKDVSAKLGTGAKNPNTAMTLTAEKRYFFLKHGFMGITPLIRATWLNGTSVYEKGCTPANFPQEAMTCLPA